MEKYQSKHKHGVGKKCCRGVEHFMQPVYCLSIQHPYEVLAMKVEVTIDKHKNSLMAPYQRLSKNCCAACPSLMMTAN